MAAQQEPTSIHKRRYDQVVLYIDREEDVTMLRERLERSRASHIVLVVPAATRVRGYAAWKLLHRYAEELCKVVAIVSTDRQVRSIAKSVKFHVAASLETIERQQHRSTTQSAS